MPKNYYLTEMVDHRVDDFYEEFPREPKQRHHPKTHHNYHESFHDWVTNEDRPKTTEHQPNSDKKLLRQGFDSDYNDKIYDKQKKWLREKTDSDDDFNFHTNLKTEKTTTKSLNKHHHKNTKTTDTTTSDSSNKYHANSQKYEDDVFDFLKNTGIIDKTTSESSNKYHANSKKYENNDFNIYKKSKTTDTTTLDSPNKYHANGQKYADYKLFDFYKKTKRSDTTTSGYLNKFHANIQNYKDDENFKIFITDTITSELPNKYQANIQINSNEGYVPSFHKNIKTTDKFISGFPNKYHPSNKKYDHDAFGFYKDTKTSDKTTPESANKYHTYKQKYYEDDDFDLRRTTKRTITEFLNKYHANNQNDDNKYFPKSFDSKDEEGNTKYTRSTGMRTDPFIEYYAKRYERSEKHSYKLADIKDEIKSYEGTDTTVRTTPTLTVQSPNSTESKATTTPLEKHYSEVIEMHKNYLPESQHGFRANTLDPEKQIPIEHKHKYNDKILYDLPISLSQGPKIESTILNTLSKSSTAENHKLSDEEKTYMEPNRIQTEETKWTWPTFEHIAEEIGMKYDWKNDRWLKLRHRSRNQMIKTDVTNDFQEKHKFSYSTIKLNSTKSRRNVVITVTAVR